MNPFKKSIKKDKPLKVTAAAIKRSSDPYLFEFEMFTLEDAREEKDGRISFSMHKAEGPYGLTSVCTKAYAYLARHAFLNSSNENTNEEEAE